MKLGFLGSAVYQAPATTGTIYAPLTLTYQLARACAELGHDVTFFGQTAGSDPFRVLNFGFPALWQRDTKPEPVFRMTYEQLLGQRAFALMDAEGFDLAQSHNFYWTSPVAAGHRTRVVQTIHNAVGEQGSEDYALLTRLMPTGQPAAFVVPSQAQAECLPGLSTTVIPNGVDLDEIPFVASPGDSLVWAGRFLPSKGPHLAIRAAQAVGRPIKLAGSIGPFLDQTQADYFAEQVEPLIDSQNVEYLGALGQPDTYRLLGQARVFVFPSDGAESFGMVSVEAMAAGTPVVGFRRGPLPELVDEGVTGILVDSPDELPEAIRRAEQLDRAACRAWVSQRFSIEAMATQYVRLYQSLL